MDNGLRRGGGWVDWMISWLEDVLISGLPAAEYGLRWVRHRRRWVDWVISGLGDVLISGLPAAEVGWWWVRHRGNGLIGWLAD